MTDHIPSGSGQVFGPYTISAYLATGTFGTLYRARSLHADEEVVLKLVQVPVGLHVGWDVFSLGDELLRFDHPSILPIHEMHLDETPPYVVMAYAPGGSLEQRLTGVAQHPLALTETLQVLSQVGAALSCLHERQVVHRGVQPASILLDGSGHALLAGFDLAIHPHQASVVAPAMTLDYHAPEEEQGIVSAQSDQYALGCLAYHLLTGQRPSSEMHRRLSRSIGERTIPAQLGRAVLRALAGLPSSRWESVADFIAALQSTQPLSE